MCFFLGGGLGILGVVYKDYIYLGVHTFGLWVQGLPGVQCRLSSRDRGDK